MEIPLVVRVEVPADDIDERGIAAKLGPGPTDDPVIGLVHALKVLLGGAQRLRDGDRAGAMWISGSAQTIVEFGQRSLIARDAVIAVRTS